METILMLIKAALYFAAIAAGLLALLFPVILDVYMRENMKVGALNYGMTFIETICLFGALASYNGTASEGFTEALGCLAIMAQIMSPISILTILLMIYVVFNNRKKKGNKK